MVEHSIIARVVHSPLDVDATAWNGLLALQDHPTPFMRHEYLASLHESGSACPKTGWAPCFMTLWDADVLVAACPLYLKPHSYGEYVFDWAWANAYEQHGVPYYPKAVVAVPFTPVPGTRLLAVNDTARALLVRAVCQWCADEDISSLHVLFASDEDVATCTQEELMLRHTVQFHWSNAQYKNFDGFLTSLTQEKRKKIRQERQKVVQAGVTFRWARGTDIRREDWDFFYRCYERTYLEHGNPPYLSRDFFARMAADLPQMWLLFTAERDGQAIATSLIAINDDGISATGRNDHKKVAYGRYWGALERVDCLHFEACYYQPLQWCIEHGVDRFEGGAQGEHKMARALLPVQATSAHWLAHPGFADAVHRYLEREGTGVQGYMDDLQSRSPFKTG